MTQLNIFLCGTGTVGGTFLQQVAEQQAYLRDQRNLDMRVVGVADIFNIITDANGIDLSNFDFKCFNEAFRQAPASSIDIIRQQALALNVSNMVFVDCTASYDVAELYLDMLSASIHVVAANKVAASGDYEHYKLLKQTALAKGVKYRHETNVGAGLPILSTISDLVASGDKITKIEAVLSGTLNYIFNTISSDITFSQAVQKAKEERFSEPDPRIDLSGIDVIRKLVILARESGYTLSQEDVEKHLFVPQEYFDGSLDDFWKNLPALDAQFEEQRQQLEKNNQHLRFVATLENGKGTVELQTVTLGHPFYNLEGSNNIVLLHTERYCPHPMMIQGYGAGAGVTAAGVFADVISIANAQL
ncbi:MAG: hypothetical protein KBT34_02235 [Prevotella sp.]|nr:hypothetical protein [Candidatus Prevotella equi]